MPNKVENICYKEIQKVANSQDNQWVHFYSLRFVFESCITLWQYTFLFFTCFTLFHSKILFWVNLAYLFIRDYLSLIRLHDKQTSGPLFMMVWLNRLMHHICGKTVCLTTNMILWYFINLGWFRQMEHTQWYQHWWIQFDAFDVWTLSNVYTLDNASQILPSARSMSLISGHHRITACKRAASGKTGRSSLWGREQNSLWRGDSELWGSAALMHGYKSNKTH